MKFDFCGVILLQIKIQIGEMIIEWDSDKAEKNVAKHHVYFEDAAQIFLDEARYIELDYEHRENLICCLY